MHTCLFFFISFALLLGAAPTALAAEDLTGVWEIGSLGADRRVEIWQDGDKFIAYRVLYPEFEGERYKLEHIFRGKIDSGQIEGTLFVREEGMRKFENLRAFIGSIESADKLMLDGLPVDRQAEQLTSKPPQLKPKKRRSRGAAKTSALMPVPIRVLPGHIFPGHKGKVI
jgi:hypothetical protein